MINRFSEMVLQGVARPRYDDRFSALVNNNHSTATCDEFVRLYNSVWGALTGTLMRKDHIDDVYYITGQSINTEFYQHILVDKFFGSTYFHNSFKGTNIYTLTDFFNHYGLAYEYSTLSGDSAIKVWNGQDEFTNMFNANWGADLGTTMWFKGGTYECAVSAKDLIAVYESKMDKNGNMYFMNESFKQISADNLKDVCKHYNVTLMPNEDNTKVIGVKLENAREFVKVAKATFEDAKIIKNDNSLLLDNGSFVKYRDYFNENRQDITRYAIACVYENDIQLLGQLIFPMCECKEQNELMVHWFEGQNNKNVFIDGVGVGKVYENGLSLLAFGKKLYIPANYNFVDSLTNSLSFVETADF